MVLVQICLNLLYNVLPSLYVMCVIHLWVKGYFPHNLRLLMFYFWWLDPFNNYTPVSISCALSKVFEKVCINELVISYKFQCVFRKDYSTHMVLLRSIDNSWICNCSLWYAWSCNGVKYSQQLIRCPVPKDQSLGLFFFLIYINDLTMLF